MLNNGHVIHPTPLTMLNDFDDKARQRSTMNLFKWLYTRKLTQERVVTSPPSVDCGTIGTVRTGRVGVGVKTGGYRQTTLTQGYGGASGRLRPSCLSVDIVSDSSRFSTQSAHR